MMMIIRCDRRNGIVELRHLQTFLFVSETLSFTRAAEELNYAQSSVTAQIQALEKELGRPLFERLGRRIVLTPVGAQLVRYAEKIVRLEEEARAALSGDEEPSGPITVGASESLLTYRLTPLLLQYRRRFPRVDVVFRPADQRILYRGLSTGELDVAVMMARDPHPLDLTRETLRAEPLLVLACPQHRLAGRSQVTAADLDGESLLLTEHGCTYRSLFERSLAAVGARPSSKVEFTSIEAIKQGVIAGMGIAVLPAMAVVTEVEQGRLAPLRWEGSKLSVDTTLVWHRDKWLSPGLAAFMKMARETLKA